MSASLVGSEMCIRDRNRSGRRIDYLLIPLEWPETVVEAFVPRGLEPVSYTHLTLPTICSV
eukprot:3163323-Alexandrium_andersonii.AAC.1